MKTLCRSRGWAEGGVGPAQRHFQQMVMLRCEAPACRALLRHHSTTKRPAVRLVHGPPAPTVWIPAVISTTSPAPPC